MLLKLALCLLLILDVGGGAEMDHNNLIQGFVSAVKDLWGFQRVALVE